MKTAIVKVNEDGDGNYVSHKITVVDKLPDPPPGCTCGHICCVCDIIKSHKPDCKYRVSATCAVPIECDHGRDVCPICDPCTCADESVTVEAKP